jgi:hypothetical protein
VRYSRLRCSHDNDLHETRTGIAVMMVDAGLTPALSDALPAEPKLHCIHSALAPTRCYNQPHTFFRSDGWLIPSTIGTSPSS